MTISDQQGVKDSNVIPGFEDFEVDEELKYYLLPLNLQESKIKDVFNKLDREE